MISAVIVYVAVRVAAGSDLDLQQGAPAGQVGDLLMFAVLSGLAAFATIEVVKRLANLRGLFQYGATARWLAARHGGAAFSALLKAIGVHYKGRDVRRLFDLPTEQLAAQIGAAVEGAFASGRHSTLIAALAGEDPQWVETLSAEKQNRPDMSADDLYVAQRVRVGVDQLQISLGSDWRRFVQGAALWVAGLYGIAFAYAGGIGSASHARYVLVALILGGVFSWIARDLSRVVENARR